MNSEDSPRTASCLYILGFLSGLVFIVLCGSSAAYNEFNEARPAHKPVEIKQKALPNSAAETTPQTDEPIDVGYGRLEQGDEFTIRTLNIDPGTQAIVRIQDGNRVLSEKTVAADANGAISADFEPLRETLSLAQVDIFVIVGETQLHRVYPLPTGTPPGNTLAPTLPLTQPARGAASPDTPTPSQTAPPPPLMPTNTAIPIPTVTSTSFPTPVPMESFYPNWRAEYYNNTTWSNAPAHIGDDQHIAFDWGENSPAPGAIGQNWFSVRWTRRAVLPEGYYTFVLSADDQAEVYVNGQKLLSYTGKTPAVNRVSRYVQGFEPLDFEVKYIEYWGNAHIQFYWEYEQSHEYGWTINYYRGPDTVGELLHNETIAGDDLRQDWRAPEHPIWVHVGYGAPFGARITRELQAPGQPGDYHLCIYTYNNVRLWLDHQQLIAHSNCVDHSCLICNRVFLGKDPPHQLSLDYMHTLGEPFLGVLTVPARDGEPWVGAFFDNPRLEGPPVVVRTAPTIDFDWAQFAPLDTGLPYDYFSARWQRAVPLVYGQYRFHVLVDDGARLRINGRTLIDQWEVGGARTFTAPYDVWGSSEMAYIELDYYDETVMAVLKLWWDAPPPTPTPTPTMTPDL